MQRSFSLAVILSACALAFSACQPPDDPSDAAGLAQEDTGSSGDAITAAEDAADLANVSAAGGELNKLYFAVVGDTRPAEKDDTAGYPTAIITKIYKKVQNLTPRPRFMVATGDYLLAKKTGVEGANQLDLYKQAAANFSGPLFAALGNHECSPDASINCAGVTDNNNYNAFLQKLIAPLGKKHPYYAVWFHKPDGSWNAKLIVIACNAWDGTQKAWLKQKLAEHSTYTILARHEPAATTAAPCVNDVEALMKQYPYDLSLVGHAHVFKHPSKREVVVGIGGAPLSGTDNYGWATVEKVSDGFKVTQYDVTTGDPVSHFTVPFHGH